MKNFLRDNKVRITALLIIVSILASIPFLKYTHDSPEEPIVTVIAEDGKKVNIIVEIADSPSERSKGLSNRKELAWNRGMLFVYEKDVENGFWMKDTTIPLSIAFINDNGTILDIQQMKPKTTEIHKPGMPYRYALEVNQGFFQKNNIEVANQVEIPAKYKK